MPQQILAQSRPLTETAACRNACTDCRVRDKCIAACALDALEPRARDEIAGDRLRLAAGEHLYWRDDRFNALYVVIAGSFKSYNVDLDGNERVRGFHYPGSLIGFDGIESSRQRCHVEAMEDAAVCALSFDRLLTLSLHTPSLQTDLFRSLSRDLVHAETLAGDYPAEVRMAAFLLEIGGDGREARLPMARRDIANYLRLATETVSRLMTRFRREGLTQCRGRSVRVVDIDGLREIAEPSLSN